MIGSHELASYPDFQSKDLQNRWDIVEHNGLCHVCLRSEGSVSHQNSAGVEVTNGTRSCSTIPRVQGEGLTDKANTA